MIKQNPHQDVLYATGHLAMTGPSHFFKYAFILIDALYICIFSVSLPAIGMLMHPMHRCIPKSPNASLINKMIFYAKQIILFIVSILLPKQAAFIQSITHFRTLVTDDGKPHVLHEKHIR